MGQKWRFWLANSPKSLPDFWGHPLGLSKILAGRWRRQNQLLAQITKTLSRSENTRGKSCPEAQNAFRRGGGATNPTRFHQNPCPHYQHSGEISPWARFRPNPGLGPVLHSGLSPAGHCPDQDLGKNLEIHRRGRGFSLIWRHPATPAAAPKAPARQI